MDKGKKQNSVDILEKKIEKVRQRREWRRFFIECTLLLAVVYLTFHYVIGIAFVSGQSMESTLKDGEMVLFYRLDNKYQRNDIVIVKREDAIYYIKRIAALGGECIELNEEKMLLIEKEVQPETRPMANGITYPYEVPEGDYFILGDNRFISKDSRIFGSVSQEEIVGRVFLHLGMVW